MSQTIISTVGTSLLSNAARHGFDAQKPDDLHALLQSEPQKASAEANAITRLVEPGDELVFLYSDTEEGQLCAGALVRYFSQQGYRSRLQRIEGLAYNEKGFISHGLRAFVRLMAQEIRAAQASGRSPLLNATGGFKAEIAYATALGLMFHTPVSYIHEKFGDIVTLPATPIGWDYSLFVWYSDFFNWMDKGPHPTVEVQSWLGGLPDTVSLLLEEADELTGLSPLGEAYLEAFRGEKLNRKPLWVSDTAMKTLDAQDFTTRMGFLHVLERLRKGDGEHWQRLTETLSGGVNKFPKGRGALRVFLVERENGLHVLEFSGHREEREYQGLMQTIRWSQYEGEFFHELP